MTKSNIISLDETFRIAKLANISLKLKEAKKIAKGLSETLEFINKVKKVNTTGIKPTSNITGLENVYREDKVTPSLLQKKALSGAKSTHNGYFKIKAIMED